MDLTTKYNRNDDLEKEINQLKEEDYTFESFRYSHQKAATTTTTTTTATATATATKSETSNNGCSCQKRPTVLCVILVGITYFSFQ
jgi:hypothetical protein